MTPSARRAVAEIHAELVAVVMTVADGVPFVLTSGSPPHLPSGPLREDHRSLQDGVRAFAREQTGHTLGFVEQLYTFADLGRAKTTDRMVSVSYLGLTRAAPDSGWCSVYELLPWEDQRGESARALRARLLDSLRSWADSTERHARVVLVFGGERQPWRPDFALQRYELLWEAGLVAEAGGEHSSYGTGPRMGGDHRRILATGLSRLRAKLQYRPVVFELMPPTFTLGQLQEVVEAVAGQEVHKQNFRRAVEQQHELVEPTDEMARGTGGRPARLYRFRREVLDERQQAGTKLPIPRAR